MLLILYITFEYLWKTKQFKDTDWLPPMLVDKMKKKKKKEEHECRDGMEIPSPSAAQIV